MRAGEKREEKKKQRQKYSKREKNISRRLFNSTYFPGFSEARKKKKKIKAYIRGSEETESKAQRGKIDLAY